MKTKVLFICEMNRMRSRTAEKIFSLRSDLEVRSAGTAENAERQVTLEDLNWADWVFVMEQNMINWIWWYFPTLPADKNIVSLELYDNYHYMDPILIRNLQTLVSAYI